jgi:5-oxopent-3-ene-1,2,5-tricarboxylate decarboxylase/2-hydroxyhepta-2,4-diene-1,7-dioate isomerase
VYGVLLNFRREAELWQDRMQQPPYKAPPQAPVLYVKTANTWNPGGAQVVLPPGADCVEAGATIGLVFGASGVAGWVLLNDFTLPHESYFRPPVKYRCLDGFLGLGDGLQPLISIDALPALELALHVNGQLRQRTDFQALVRSPAQLVADVGEFMTLRPGDVLMLGTDCEPDGARPRLKAGDQVQLSAPGLPPLCHRIVQETQA